MAGKEWQWVGTHCGRHAQASLEVKHVRRAVACAPHSAQSPGNRTGAHRGPLVSVIQVPTGSVLGVGVESNTHAFATAAVLYVHEPQVRSYASLQYCDAGSQARQKEVPEYVPQ